MRNCSEKNMRRIKSKPLSKINIFEDSLNVVPLLKPELILNKSRSKSYLDYRKSKTLQINNLKSNKIISQKEKSSEYLKNIMNNENLRIIKFNKMEKEIFNNTKQSFENFMMISKNYEICSNLIQKKNKPIDMRVNSNLLQELFLLKYQKKKIFSQLRYYDELYNDIEGSLKDQASDEMMKKIEIHKTQILFLYDNLEGGIFDEIERTLNFMPNVIKNLESSNNELKEKLNKNKNGIEKDIEYLKVITQKKNDQTIKLSNILKEYHYQYLKK